MPRNQIVERPEVAEILETTVVIKSPPLEALIASLAPKPVPVVQIPARITQRRDPYGFD
jgi:hypothetical protein